MDASIFPQQSRHAPGDGSFNFVANPSIFPSALTGATYGTSQPGERWIAVYNFDEVADPGRQELISWATSLRGARRAFVHDWSVHSYAVRNIITDDGFAGPFPNSWDLAVVTTSATLENAGRYGYATRVESNSNGARVRQRLTAVASLGQPYFFRLNVLPGYNPSNSAVPLRFNSDAGTTDEFTLLPGADETKLSSGGVYQGLMIPTTSTIWISMVTDNLPLSTMYWSDIQVSQCAIVKVASQTGSRLTVIGLPRGQAEALPAGHYVEIINCLTNSFATALHRLIVPADTRNTNSGEAVLYLDRPMRIIPRSGHPVNLYRPSMLARVGASVAFSLNNLQRSTFTMEFEEQFT